MTNHLIAVLISAGMLAEPALADPVKITFLGVGDVYNFDGNGSQGGFARLNAVARAERAANPTRSMSLTAICCRPVCCRALTTART